MHRVLFVTELLLNFTQLSLFCLYKLLALLYVRLQIRYVHVCVLEHLEQFILDRSVVLRKYHVGKLCNVGFVRFQGGLAGVNVVNYFGELFFQLLLLIEILLKELLLRL